MKSTVKSLLSHLALQYALNYRQNFNNNSIACRTKIKVMAISGRLQKRTQCPEKSTELPE